MAIEQLAQPCWYATYPGGEEHQNWCHYDTETAAHDEARDLTAEDPDRKVTVGCHTYRCWTATCDGDGEEEYEDDEFGSIHFGSAAEAEQTLREAEWFILRDGRVLCFDCPPGENDEEDEVPAEISGQEALPGLGGTDA